MLGLSVTVDGDKVVIAGLDQFASHGIDNAAQRGLRRSGAGIYAEALKWLSGEGGTGKRSRTDYEGFERKNWGENKQDHYQMFRSYTNAGGYPVPVRTGNLRRLLDWVPPGESKGSEGDTFSAGPLEIIIYDSAEYAESIFLGKGSSAKFGKKRDALTDGLDKFNQGDRIKGILEEEIAKEIKF